MKAVNLIPEDQRAGRRGLLGDAGGATRALLGALLLALVVVVAHTMLTNAVADRRASLAHVEAQTRALQVRADALKPYGAVAVLRERRVGAVRTLAGERFDWARLMGDLAGVLPADVTLVALSGTAPDADPAASGAAGAAGAGVAAGSTLQLSGCTTDHRAVALVMERLRSVRGVADVQLGSANKVGERASDSSSGGCPRRDQFQLALTLAAPAAAPTPAAGVAR